MEGGGFKLNPPPLVLGGHEVFGELNDKPVGGVYGAVTCGKCDYCRTGRENLCNELTFLGEGSLGGIRGGSGSAYAQHLRAAR